MEVQVPDSPYLLELTNTFSIDAVVQGFVLKEPNGRKSYVKGKTIKWNVNSDDFTMDVLIDGLSESWQWINVDLGFKVHPPLQKPVAGRPRVQRIRGWLEPGRKIVKCKKCGEPGHMEKTCKAPDPKYVAVNDDDDIPEDVPDPSTPTKKRKEGDETAATTDGDAADDEVLINLIRKRARTTPQKPNTLAKEKIPVKIATTQEKAKKKTPVKKATSHEKAKKKTLVKKATSQQKTKKKTPVKKTISKRKKNVPFAPVMPAPPPPPSVEQPAHGAKRSLLYWLGG